MSNRPRADIAEITFQAYASRHQTNEEQRKCWRLRTRVALMAIVSTVIASLIIYWFVNSILVSRNFDTNDHHDSTSRDQHRFSSKMQSRNKRLPTQVVPLEYTLKIIPVLEEGNFTILGYTEIQLYCYVPTKHIRLHAHKLVIENITIEESRPGNATRMIAKYVFELDDDFLDIFLLQLLTQGESYILKIKYTACLTEEPIGLFRSKYEDKGSNLSRRIAVSNFSPDFARRAFPCFDEPSIKTPFRISIGRRADMRTHSNFVRLTIEKIYDIPGYVWDHYEKSPPMSTYLTAFMVTDFQSYQINATGHPFHTVFARRDVQNDTVYIGHLIPRIVRLMENLTGFHYDLNKLDVIAVPYLAYLAMENWGLITFRIMVDFTTDFSIFTGVPHILFPFLLYTLGIFFLQSRKLFQKYHILGELVDKHGGLGQEDSIVVSNETRLIEVKHRFARIASHEVAHQWFGNLVTPKWWTDVWLKESFSSFFGTMALSMADPSLSMQDMMAEQYREMFESEVKEMAHPLHLNITRKNNLQEVFDSTPYVKGNCIINMIYHFLGEATFFSSIRRYIRTYYYRSADQDDLWDIFQEEITLTKSLPEELSMKSIMNTWTHQAGFPVVHVFANNQTGLVELTQERFYRLGLSGTTINSEELWRIPLTWTIESDQRFDETLPKAWMLQRRIVINDTVLSEAIFNNQWILFNINQTGLYRVNYDDKNWKLLVRRFNLLPEMTKLQVLSDVSAMFNAGLIEHDILLDILYNLDENTEESVWLSATASWNYIKYRLWDSEDFEITMYTLLDKVYRAKAKSLTMKSKSWTTFKLEITKLACSMGHKMCLEILDDYAWKLLFNHKPSTYDDSMRKFREWACCTYLKVSGPKKWTEQIKRCKIIMEWPETYGKYRTIDVFEKPMLAYARGCVPNATFIKEYLSHVSDKIGAGDINSTINTPSYLGDMLRSIADNPNTFEIAMDFLERIEKMNMSRSIINSYEQFVEILSGFSNTMDQEENVKWLTRFKTGDKSKYESMAIESVINDVKFNVAWNRRHRNSMLKAFRKIASKIQESEQFSKN